MNKLSLSSSFAAWPWANSPQTKDEKQPRTTEKPAAKPAETPASNIQELGQLTLPEVPDSDIHLYDHSGTNRRPLSASPKIKLPNTNI